MGAAETWLFATTGPADLALTANLNPEEQQRAARFRDSGIGSRWSCSRGTLRRILAHYCGVPAREIRFGVGEQGKPHISFPDGGPHFNLSHSGDYAVVAVSREAAVGVDIERIRPGIAALEIAERFFAPGEREFLRSADDGAQLEVFTRIWVRKEAYVKGTGKGIAEGLQKFCVTDAGREGCRIARDGEVWTIQDHWAPQGYCAALAIASEELTVRSRRLNELTS